MKIAMIVPSLVEKGPIIVAFNIVKYNFDKNIEFMFISLRNNLEVDKRRFKELNINVYEIGMERIPTLRAIYKLQAIIDNLMPDVLHVHCFWPTILAAICKKKYKNLITTLHNNPFEDYSLEYGTILGKTMARISVKIANNCFREVVAISNYVKAIYNNKKINVIYNAIEDFPQLNEKRYLEDNVLHVVSASVLNKRKNIETALKTIRYLKNKGKKIQYIIIGDGEMKRSLERITQELAIKDEVIFCGALSREKTIEILGKQDVLLFPSVSEGLGLAAIEAMMNGVVVVGSNIPVMNEIVDHLKDGFICDVFDYEEYGQKLLKLYDVELLRTMSEAARNKYLNKFQMTYMIKEYNELYYKCLE